MSDTTTPPAATSAESERAAALSTFWGQAFETVTARTFSETEAALHMLVVATYRLGKAVGLEPAARLVADQAGALLQVAAEREKAAASPIVKH